MIKLVIINALFTLMAALPAMALPPENNACKEVAYENHNQVDYGPLVIQEIKGLASDPDHVPIPQVCIGLFTGKDHKLVASFETDAKGKFSLSDIPPGEYRLVAKYDPFCAASVSVRVVKHAKRKRPLQVHMRPSGPDTCSYVDFKG